jgi:hypothetical protein
MTITLKVGSVVTIPLPGPWPNSTSDVTICSVSLTGSVVTIAALKKGQAWLKFDPRPDIVFMISVNVV